MPERMGIGSMTGGDPLSLEWQNSITEYTYWMYMVELMDIYCSVFDWRNLPRGCDARQMEWWLMTCGFVGFVYDPALAIAQPRQAPLGYGVMRLAFDGELDMYNLPESRTAYSVANGATNIRLDEDTSVIVFNDQMRVSPMPMIQMHAWRLTNAQRSLDSNVAQQKFAKMVKGTQKQMRALKKMMGATYAGVPIQFVDTDFDSPIEAIDIAADDRISSLMNVFDDEWSRAKNFAGIESSRQKNERMFTAEANANLAGTDAFRFTRLVPREKACAEMNVMCERLGYFEVPDPITGELPLPIEVSFREGAYVQADPASNDGEMEGEEDADAALRDE